jgi:hypothetical protein
LIGLLIALLIDYQLIDWLAASAWAWGCRLQQLD